MSLILIEPVWRLCVNKLTIFGSDNGLSSGRHQAIIWTNAGILSIGPPRNKLQWNLNLNSYIFIKENSFWNVVWKWRPFCLGLNELTENVPNIYLIIQSKSNQLSVILINFWYITMTSYWVSWRLKSPASPWFVQLLVHAQIKEKHQRSASLAFVRGIHRWPVNSPHKRTVTQEMFPFDDVIMNFDLLSTNCSLVNLKQIVWLTNLKMELKILFGSCRSFSPSLDLPSYDFFFIGMGICE